MRAPSARAVDANLLRHKFWFSAGVGELDAAQENQPRDFFELGVIDLLPGVVRRVMVHMLRGAGSSRQRGWQFTPLPHCTADLFVQPDCRIAVLVKRVTQAIVPHHCTSETLPLTKVIFISL